MFERYTDRARRIVVLAQEESRMLNHHHIGSEHILLGLIHEGEGVAAKALTKCGVTLEGVRRVLEPERGNIPSSGHIPFTPTAKRDLELGLREALQLGHGYIGTEHVLLGLVRSSDTKAAAILDALGTDTGAVRKAVIDELSGYKSAPDEPEQPDLPEPKLGCPHAQVDDSGVLVLRPYADSDERCDHGNVSFHLEFEVQESKRKSL